MTCRECERCPLPALAQEMARVLDGYMKFNGATPQMLDLMHAKVEAAINQRGCKARQGDGC